MKYTEPRYFKLFDFELYNIEEFIQDSHPEINPILEEKRYRTYWEDVLQKTMTGMWGRDYDKKKDKGGYRYMSNDLYHYRNIFYMIKEEIGEPIKIEHPSLRDVDWFITYNFMIMEGFSGFKDDKKYTSNLLAKNYKSYKEVEGYDKIFFDKYADDLLDKYGKIKEYVDPREYLYKTHREPLGNPLYHNENKNLVWFATRRFGKSYHLLNKNQRGFVTNNAISVEQYYKRETNFVGIFGSWDSVYVDEHYTKFLTSYNMLKDIGAYRKDGISYNGALWTPLFGGKKVGEFITNRGKAKGGKFDVGNGSQLHKLTFGENISKAVGVASNFAMMDELGIWEDPYGVWGETEPTQKRETKFASQVYAGTGGQVTKVMKSLEMFKNPGKIKALGFPDLCDPTNKNEIGLFTNDVYRRDAFRDENGNTDTVNAYKQCCKERKDEYNKGLEAYIKHITGFPMMYKDIFMQSSSGIIPVDRASERLNTLKGTPINKRETTYAIGKFKRDKDKNVEFYAEKNVLPIHCLDDLKTITEEQKKGIILMYEPPEKGAKYLTVYDPVKDLSGTSMCVAATFKIYGIGKGIRMNIVCESIYRFILPKDNDDVAINMALYYGCKLGAETNASPHILTYSKDIGLYDSLLENSPELAIGMLVKNAQKKYDKGVFMLPHMKEKTPQVITEVLIASVDTKTNEDGSKEDILMVDEIPSEFLLEEIIYWSLENNYDYVSALYIFALYMKEYALRKMLDEPKEGNDLLQKVIEGIKQDIKNFEHDIYTY